MHVSASSPHTVMTKHRIIIGITTLTVVLSLFYFLRLQRLASAEKGDDSKKLTAQVLMEYLPEGFLDEDESVILFYSSSFDSLRLSLIDDAFDSDGCSSIKYVLIADVVGANNNFDLRNNLESKNIVMVKNEHRDVICIECGFTAFLNPGKMDLMIEKYRMDPYVACEYFKLNPTTRNSYTYE